jgi:hypothetical protein
VAELVPLSLAARLTTSHLTFLHRNLSTLKCQFTKCHSDVGGAIDANLINTTLIDTVFNANHARVGGAVRILRSRYLYMLRVLVFNNSAQYDGGFALDTEFEGNFSVVERVNITLNSAAKWTGGMRLDHAGGIMKDSWFDGNTATVCGGFFDFTWEPTRRDTTHCVFKNNSAVSRGGAYCAFHILHRSDFRRCMFVQNYCKLSAYSISVESIGSDCGVWDCYFDGKRDQQVRMRF